MPRYEEWWIGPPSGNPTEMTEWRRPYRDTKAAPHDIWLMEQPVTTATAHVWVDNGIVWGLPLYAPSQNIPCVLSSHLLCI